ncbi:MAG: hypothetical protein A2747_01760 [Candidatus Yonathbacteria bacterium RIFCSPHIGHO2_01_FULL_44_41]|uniref:histidine kinase n=1 Tax=Candidatus Yonathbacteria bacterium RIFCSPHIGHO2_02_FULL_44_14 TaxID=1802724 RepID=A0A1G2SA49_9BACT|nr:MAG: hypothetical protein A2747_01760 [Candidatus Yonathbacteria bacterium RIFCSPHIGHO2_01_FULL_44_41]OHA81588.1 MAG: hypothetical protein A3D51_02335 [Candidatus Yonathbacteria bacterium RIFCSPHIGHO2_02_FULL_44_14]OHA81769.1 MAG: hypothetical protein A3B06_02270 [Candidatus Yonathbacteria bacterium RIFCSPLOWO2_01_FULL_43_20]
MSLSILDIISNISFAEWVIAIGSLLVTVLSGVIFWQDTKKQSSKFFLIFSIIVFMWGAAFIIVNASIGTQFVHTAVDIFYFIAGFIAPTLFFAIDAFSNRDRTRSFGKFAIVFGPYLILSLGFFVPGLIVGYEEIIGGGWGKITFGKLFILYALYCVALVVLGFGLLVKKYHDSAGIFKVEMRDFLVAFIVTALVALLGTLFLPVFTGTQDFFWVGYVGGALLFLVITRLLAVKYNFWSPKVIVTELFISVIVLVLIAELFIASSFLDLFIKTGITVLIIFSSSFLIGSVKREIQSKDKIMRLSRDIDLISKRLKVLDKKKSEFLSIASHHLRDPLTVIKGYASMLGEGSFGELSAPVKEAVEKIFHSSERLITMISDFMDISRIESGDMRYKFADVDMKRLVLDITGEMKQSADRAHLTFNTTINDGISNDEQFITVGDAGKLRQVISNLIDNSIKYTPRGEISLLLSKSTNGKKILFSISDTGIGMSEVTKEKIFRKFSRAEGVSKVYTEGTGLGLYVAKEVIKKHEGRIWAESKGEGAGSTFYLELEVKR